MPERTYQVRPVGVEYACDVCRDGRMEQTGIFYPTDPPMWPHRCNRCGHEAKLMQQYPTVRWERVEEW